MLGLWQLARFCYTSFYCFGPVWPEVILRPLWPGCTAGDFGGLASALPCPPVFGIILPDGLIEVFFKLRFVLNAVGDVPQLFVQQLPKHYAFLRVLLIADIALVLEAAFFGRWGENGSYPRFPHPGGPARGWHCRTENLAASAPRHGSFSARGRSA